MISPAPDCEAKVRVAPILSASRSVPLNDAVANALLEDEPEELVT